VRAFELKRPAELLPQGTSHELDVREPLPTGFDPLDAVLPGGFLRGQIAELSGAPSSGKRAIALSLCARAFGEGLGAAWIDAHGGFCPLPALEAGLPLSNLLVVRVKGAKPACKAASLILRSPGAVGVLVLDIEGNFSLPDASLARLRHLAAEGGCAVLFVTERDANGPALSTFVSLRLAVRRIRGGLIRSPEPHGTLVPWKPEQELSITVLKNKFGPVRSTAEVEADEPDRLRVDSTL
jgi:hypothetical protein